MLHLGYLCTKQVQKEKQRASFFDRQLQYLLHCYGGGVVLLHALLLDKAAVFGGNILLVFVSLFVQCHFRRDDEEVDEAAILFFSRSTWCCLALMGSKPCSSSNCLWST